MFVYEKRLQYPINIKQTNPKLAQIIISQYGGRYCKKIYILSIKKYINTSVVSVKYNTFHY